MKKHLYLVLFLALTALLVACRAQPADMAAQLPPGSAISQTQESNADVAITPSDIEESSFSFSEPSTAVSSEESSKSSNSKTGKNESSVPVTVIEKPKTSNSITTFEEGKREQEKKVEEYLKEHDINPDTAGETGKTCHCGKKLWDANKYGLANPGHIDYENSGYCNGWCSVVLG